MRTLASLFTLSLGVFVVVGCSKFESPDLTMESDGPLASDARATAMFSLQIGEQPGAFEVEDVTGPSAGEVLCYRCKYSGKPTVVIFARELNDSVTNLVQQIDQKVTENSDKKLSAFMVMVGDDTDKVKPELQRVQVARHIQNTPLTVYNRAEGPAGYGLSPTASIQVMMWNHRGVKVNKPMPKDLSPEDITEVVSQTSEILN